MTVGGWRWSAILCEKVGTGIDRNMHSVGHTWMEFSGEVAGRS